MDGNSGTSAATNYLGTQDAQALVFRTNNSEVMRIVAAGKVGIGTDTPNEQVEITGNFRLPQTDVTHLGTVGVIYMGWNTLMHTYGTDNYFTGLNSDNLHLTGHANE